MCPETEIVVPLSGFLSPGESSCVFLISLLPTAPPVHGVMDMGNAGVNEWPRQSAKVWGHEESLHNGRSCSEWAVMPIYGRLWHLKHRSKKSNEESLLRSCFLFQLTLLQVWENFIIKRGFGKTLKRQYLWKDSARWQKTWTDISTEKTYGCPTPHEKMLSITQGNANRNYSEIAPHTCHNG